MDGVLYLVLPLVGIACGAIGWPVLQDQARRKCEQAEREALSKGAAHRAPAGSNREQAAAAPVESDDCGYISVIGDTLITAHGLECSARDPWSAEKFVETAQEIARL